MKPRILRIGYLRLLKVIDLLNEETVLVSSDGLTKLIRGLSDTETSAYKERPYFGISPSLSPKKIKGRVHYLVARGYISLEYLEAMGDYSLSLTEKGREAVSGVLLKKKKVAPPKPTIIQKHQGEKQ